MKTMKEYLSTPEGVRQMWAAINHLIDSFDFNKVAVVMKTLSWHWSCSPEEAKIYSDLGCDARTSLDGSSSYYYPEAPQLIKRARERLVGAIESMPDNETWWCEDSAGFRAEVSICDVSKFGDEADDFSHAVSLRLSFDVEEATTY